MQNRNMFPYRRQGSKKRGKNGGLRKLRGPHKPLPNSARDLLPLLQPATKALAQMLVGRAGMGNQLEHARALVAQAERLIGERQHNRFNPAEREEFFEQLARLKLTITDAEVEAEVRADEEQTPKPAAPPVARERLKEMALALTAPAPARRQPEGPDATPDGEAALPERAPQAPPEEAERTTSLAPPRPGATGVNARAGRLQLSRGTSEQVAGAVEPARLSGMPVVRTRRRMEGPREQPVQPSAPAAEPAAARAPGAPQPVAATTAVREPATEAGGDALEPGAAKPNRPRRPKNKGLPEGWVIDDEGFVVPGPG